MRKSLLIFLFALATIPSVAQSSKTKAASIPLNDAVGVCAHFGHGWEPVPLMSKIRELGVGWIRDGIYWPEVEPEKGKYRIPAQTQHWVDEANRQGLKVLFSFSKSNPSYQGFDIDAYAAAAAYVAKSLRGKVQAIEVLNEPNNASAGFRKFYGGEWSGIEKDGSISPWLSKYVELLNATAKAVKKANPEMKVLGLGATTAANQRVLPMIAPEVDGITDHPYSSRSIPESSGSMEHDSGTGDDSATAGTFQHLVASYRAKFADTRQREIWFTEWGFSTFHEEGRPNPGHFASFTPDEQAVYEQRRLLEGFGLGVDHSFIYEIKNEGLRANEVEDNFGLLNADLSQRRSYAALKPLIQQSVGWKPTPLGTAIVRGATTSWRAYLFNGSKQGADLFVWKAVALSDTVSSPVDVAVKGCVNSASVSHATNTLTGKQTSITASSESGALILRGVPLAAVPHWIHLDCQTK